MASTSLTITQQFERYVVENHRDALVDALTAPDLRAPYAVRVDALKLFAAVPMLANAMLHRPLALMPALDEALRSAQGEVMRATRAAAEAGDGEAATLAKKMSVKEIVRARVDADRLCETYPELAPGIGSIRTRHVNRMWCVEGVAVRVGSAKSLEAEQVFECVKCGHQFLIPVNVEEGSGGEPPPACPRTKPCKGKSFRSVPAARRMVRDYQEIRIQEPVGGPAGGSARAAARALRIVLEDDLVDKVQAGDDVKMAVVVRRRWYKCAREQRCEVELVGHCVSLHVKQKQQTVERIVDDVESAAFAAFWREHESKPFYARDMILRAMCPQLFGMATPKLALMLALIGGVPRRDSSGGRVRGESHILLVGDPGMGKSQLLKYAAAVAPRAIMTTGMGSSAAGLTVAATKESGEWALEAGALVLADGGVCCIDEFDSIREAERATIHEAMEQQTLSVAKAGMVTTLRTRTTVIGATNPKGGQFDMGSSLAVNTGLAPPLLSRFDCLIVLRDDRKPSWDRAVSAHILETHARLGAIEDDLPSGTQSSDGRGRSSLSSSVATQPGSSQLSDGVRWGRALEKWGAVPQAAEEVADDVAGEIPAKRTKRLQDASVAAWPFDRLRRYIAHVKNVFQPQLTSDAERLLTAYYQAQRRLEGRSVARTTIRMLESLIRLTQAHARLMYRDVATRLDATVAVCLVEASMLSLAPFITLPATNAGFADDADASIREIEARLARRLDEELGSEWRDGLSAKRNRGDEEENVEGEDEENDFRRGNVRRNM